MIPVNLTLRGFLSYQQETRIDFSHLEVACVSGPNGSGKSSLFDAITWVLFGRARRNDDALINDASQSCLVAMEFDYESNRYRIERSKEKSKGTLLEFQIQTASGDWKPLTEAGMRSTEDRIREVLNLDYDTFINSSFFLQGKADLFAQQAPARRKEILSVILGLEIWESYREEAALRRRNQEEQLNIQQQLLNEILAELGQERERVEKLGFLQDSLQKTSALCEEKEKSFNQARSEARQLMTEREKLDLLASQLEANQKRLAGIEGQLAARQAELKLYEQTLIKEEEIGKAYQQWQALRHDLEKWDALAGQFHQLQSSRQEFTAAIQTEEARLHQEYTTLQSSWQEMETIRANLPALEADLQVEKQQLAELETCLEELHKKEEELSSLQSVISEKTTENVQFRKSMDELKEQGDTLEKTAGSSQCPLCGQPLTDSHRAAVLAQITEKGKTMGNAFRENLNILKETGDKQVVLKKEIEALRKKQAELAGRQKIFGQKDQRLADDQRRLEKWQKEGEPRLQELEGILSKEEYSRPVRVQLQQVDASLAKLGYQPEEHDKVRQDERDAREIEEAYRNLEKARTAVETLRREVQTLQESRGDLVKEIKQATGQQDELQAGLEKRRADLPDVTQLEGELNNLHREENDLRQQVGAAQQMVDVLDKQRQRQVEIEGQMEEIKQQIANLRALELAFGKDGVPALLIEQALPEIESQANDILDRLSSGRMSVTFATEREYKDKKREDKRQTLDILISDASGQREYELFSGGEAFRINFAIRLALSRVLATRAGARLQTLVIDEGFGSQDAEGRQRLIEAINLVSQDFAKILVITHLDELKDAFPSRIEVQKTQNGSVVEVIP